MLGCARVPTASARRALGGRQTEHHLRGRVLEDADDRQLRLFPRVRIANLDRDGVERPILEVEARQAEVRRRSERVVVPARRDELVNDGEPGSRASARHTSLAVA